MRKYIQFIGLFVLFFLFYNHNHAYAEAKYAKFTIISNSAEIYEKKNGALVSVGTLAKNQTFASDYEYTSWHKFKIAGKEVFIHKNDTKTTATTKKVSHRNHTNREFTLNKNVIVYDNSGKILEPIAELYSGRKLIALKEYSSWISIQLSDRIGYIKKSEVSLGFSPSDSYFQANADTGIYVKVSSKLRHIGTIKKGQVYPIEGHNTSWLAISLNGVTGFIQKEKASPVVNSSLRNEVKRNEPIIGTIKMINTSKVYDNTSGSLIPFATLNKSTTINVTKVYSSWLKVEVAGRFGYVRRDHATFESQFDKYLLGKKIDSEQMLVVESKSASSIYATLSLYEKKADTWRKTLTTSAVLGKNGSSSKKREGDGKTPTGLFPLRSAFGTKVKPSGVSYPYKNTTANDYWVDDPASSDYNTWKTYKGDPKRKWKSFEKLTNSLYRHAIVIGYNDQPIVKGKGSAIFLHVWRSSKSPTLGCVAIPEDKLVQILRKLEVEKNPHILIGTKGTLPTIYTE